MALLKRVAMAFSRREQTAPAPSLFELARARRIELARDFVSRYGRSVLYGPFKGLLVPEHGSWGIADVLLKVLGQYERELQDSLIALHDTIAIDRIVDVGCADGYYAVGLARLFTEAEVLAFDIDERAQTACLEAARENGLVARVRVGGFCGTDELQAALAPARAPLVFCDCEGYEVELIDPEAAPALSKAWLIVECHEFMRPGSTRVLIDRLAPTHKIREVREGARDPNIHSSQRSLSSLDRWLTVCEFRPETMNWLICEPRRETAS